MTAPTTTEARLPKWRGWTEDGRSLGVCEARNHDEAVLKFQKAFGQHFSIITTAFIGAKVTV